MRSPLPRYEAKCVQRRCFQCRSVPLHSDIKRTELPPVNILIPLERQLIALQLCRWEFFIMKLFSRLFVLCCRNCPKDDKFGYFIPILSKLGAAYSTLVDGSLESPCGVLVKYNWISFSFSCGWGATRQNVSKLAAFKRGYRSLGAKISGRRVRPCEYFFIFCKTR